MLNCIQPWNWRTPTLGLVLTWLTTLSPLQFTEEDFDQVLTGNFVTKVIYLPDPDFQGPALAGIDTLVSTRLDPGIDPIVEADRRGSILAIIRLGDKDIEMSGSNEMLSTGGAMRAPLAGLPAAFAPAMTEGCGNCPDNGAAMPPALPGMISGVTTPQYGMPMSATPIGLPGPPHIPMGHPAGLKSMSCVTTPRSTFHGRLRK